MKIFSDTLREFPILLPQAKTSSSYHEHLRALLTRSRSQNLATVSNKTSTILQLVLVPKPTTRTLFELSSSNLSSHKQAFVGGARDKPKDRPRRRLILFTLVSIWKASYGNEVDYKWTYQHHQRWQILPANQPPFWNWMTYHGFDISWKPFSS